MENVLLTLVVSAANVFCFALGVKVGRLGKGEKILPSLPNPIAQRQADKQAAKREQEAMNVILQNVENYNGTPAGQKDIPWR